MSRASLLPVLIALSAAASAAPTEWSVDPVTRYVHFSYHVPAGAPAEVTVRCEVRRSQDDGWRPAAVLPYVSETALGLMTAGDWERAMLQGIVVERLAQGLVRTVVWNPFLLDGGKMAGRFRITVLDRERALETQETAFRIDNSDVVLIDDWSRVIQKESISTAPARRAAVWWYRTGQQGSFSPFRGTSLEVAEKNVELPQLTYPLDLRGPYAIFVSLPAKLGAIELRLTGDERSQIFSTQRPGQETFWRQADLTRQHLVIRQPYRTVYEYEDTYRAHLDTVRLVPLLPETARALAERWAPIGPKRVVAGYNEPYSWAFYEKVESTLQHWEPLSAFAEARVDILDTQFGRGGSRLVSETRVGSQLIGQTMGDPVRGATPRTSNVGRMQQYTNMLATQLAYARRLGMRFHANLGATNCYPGTPLESAFSREHPEWRDGSHLRYEVPEVRRYVLALFREALEEGAEALSIDWCRYPNSVRRRETVTGFFRELRALAGEMGRRRGIHVAILTRFPARGVTGWQYMDYATWAKEGLVDYLAPGNIQGRHMNFDLGEYLRAVQGTKARLLPAVDGLYWGLPWPGMMYQRILKGYREGAAGVYLYQADSPILSSPATRRYVSLAGYPEALERWERRERAEQARYSKGIYWTEPEGRVYHPYDRMRFWVEGFEPAAVEILVDGAIVNRYAAAPYVLTSEDRSDDAKIAPGRHTIRVRARDGRHWLEREFEAQFAR